MERYTLPQLKKICTENKPKGVSCAGKGTTRAYLFEKLSKLGLLQEEEEKSVSNTMAYLLTLTSKDLDVLHKLHLGITSEKDSTVHRNKDPLFQSTVLELALLFSNTPYPELLTYCRPAGVLCSDRFFRSIMRDVYPDIHELFGKVKITERKKAFHDAYHPQRADMSGKVLKGKKRVFHFWEHLYSEIDLLSANEEGRRALESGLNEDPIDPGPAALLLSPFVLLFLASVFPMLVETVLIPHDSPVYSYLDISEKQITEDFFKALASYEKPNGIIKFLLTDPRLDPSVNNNEAIQSASENGNAEIVKLLLSDSRVDPAANRNYAIEEASRYGYPEVVKLLLADARVDPAVRNNYAIQMSSSHGRAEVVKLLLADARVDPAAYDNAAILRASENGYPEVVKLLLADSRVNPAAEKNRAIQWASFEGHPEVVKLLLADSRVNPAAEKNRAIRWASENGNLEVVKLLLADPRVDPTVRDNYAIQIASENGHPEVVKLLLADPRVDPTVRDNYATREASSLEKKRL